MMYDALWLTIFVVAVFVDVILAFGNRTPNSKDTLSGRMRQWGRSFAAVPMFMGAVSGHFWLPREGGPILGVWSPLVMLAVAIVVTTIHRHWGGRSGWWQIAYLIIGIPLGHLLWAMG